MSTIIIGCGIIVLLVFVIKKLIKDKQHSSCNGTCGGCKGCH